MAFDPDAYLAKYDKSGFDPDAYLAKYGEKETPIEDVPANAWEDLKQNAAGIIEGTKYVPGFQAISMALTGENPYSQKNVLEQGQAFAKTPSALIDRAKELGADELLTGNPINAAGKAYEAFKEKPISTAMDLYSAGKFGLGASRLGAKALASAPESLRNASYREAVKAAILQKSNLNRLAKAGISPETAGKFLLENDVVKPFSSAQGRAEAMAAIKEGAGKTIGDVGQTLENAGVNEFDPLKAAMNLDENAALYRGKESFQPIANKYDSGINDILNMGEKGAVTGPQVKDFEKLFKDVGYKKGLPVESAIPAQDVARSVEKEYVESIGRGAERIGDTNLQSRYLKAKEVYRPAAQLSRELEDVSLADQGRRTIGLTDTIAAAGELGATGSLGKAGVMLGAKKAVEGIFHGTAAKGLNKMAEISEKVSQSMPVLKVKDLAKAVQIDPSRFGRYAPQMMKWASQGIPALAVNHYLMSQRDPEYNETIINGDQQ